MDLQNDLGQIGVTTWRCTGGGEVIDSMNLQDLAGLAPNVLYGTKQRNYAQQVPQDETLEPADDHGRGKKSEGDE